jgi:hypothetical protein
MPARSIGIATGLLMERFHLDELDAYHRLRRYARSQRLKIVEVTDALVAASTQLVHLLNAIAAMTRSDSTAAGGSQSRESGDSGQ